MSVGVIPTQLPLLIVRLNPQCPRSSQYPDFVPELAGGCVAANFWRPQLSGRRAGYFTFEARKRLTHDFIAHQWVLESAQGLLLAPFVACDILLDQQGGVQRASNDWDYDFTRGRRH